MNVNECKFSDKVDTRSESAEQCGRSEVTLLPSAPPSDRTHRSDLELILLTRDPDLCDLAA